MKEHKLVEKALKHPEKYSFFELQWLQKWWQDWKVEHPKKKKKKK